MKKVSNVCVKNSQMLTGLLIDYEIENYGETNSFFVSDGQILDTQIDSRRARSGMPKEYAYKTGKDFAWSRYGEDVQFQKNVTNAFVWRFDEFRKQGRGLYIHSKTKGSGKTMLACCITNEVLKRHDIPVKFISMPEYIELVRDKNEGARERVQALMDAVLLVVDDIGTTSDDKEWISNSIFRLVNRRHENLLPTIYTSNVPILELKCDERITSRIYEDAISIAMPEISIRREKADLDHKEFLEKVMKE